MQLGSTLIFILDGVIVKGVVMVFCAWLLVRIWRSIRPASGAAPWLTLTVEQARELRVVVGSLVLFAASEAACVVDGLMLGQAPLWDGAHSVTSALGTGLFALWTVQYVDRDIVRFSKPACVLNRACRGCTFSQPERCKVLNLALLVGVFVASLGILPLFVSVAPIPTDPKRYALPFDSLNAWYDGVRASFPRLDASAADYQMPRSTLILEMRVIPLAGGALALASLLLMRARRESLGLRVLGFGAGMLGYAYLELALYAATREPIIGSLGHELAELWFLLATAEVLRRAFGHERKGLRLA